MEVIIAKSTNRFFNDFLTGCLKCLIPLKQFTAIKLRIRIDTTFCKRNIDMIGLRGVNLFIVRKS